MITLEANYSKKIGLPQYSSHQFSITLRTELADINQVTMESERLYRLLQESVDASIKDVGFLPGQNPPPATQSVPIRVNGGQQHPINPRNGNGHLEPWECSDKQKALILKIVSENNLDKNAVDQLAMERFSKGVRSLNKLEASGLIEELLEQVGAPSTQHSSRKGARK